MFVCFVLNLICIYNLLFCWRLNLSRPSSCLILSPATAFAGIHSCIVYTWCFLCRTYTDKGMFCGRNIFISDTRDWFVVFYVSIYTDIFRLDDISNQNSLCWKSVVFLEGPALKAFQCFQCEIFLFAEKELNFNVSLVLSSVSGDQ